MASPALPSFMHERVDFARGLLADSADHQGSQELSNFVEAMKLTERFHTILLDSEGRRRPNVSRKDKQEVGEQAVSWAYQAGAAAQRRQPAPPRRRHSRRVAAD